MGKKAANQGAKQELIQWLVAPEQEHMMAGLQTEAESKNWKAFANLITAEWKKSGGDPSITNCLQNSQHCIHLWMGAQSPQGGPTADSPADSKGAQNPQGGAPPERTFDDQGLRTADAFLKLVALADPSMSDLQIQRTFPPNGDLQLFQVCKPVSFICAERGGKSVKSNKVAVDWSSRQLLSNGGYGQRLKK
eukprot:TRINITY_DN24785_c0_g1_i1.p1 TRINITY_DN24785_c0_g1~~TRINITY_DN24785_c0_g1_i1.p1  ORF type:complete len:192 (+),score=35.34 TRINITY_DN24785_c0_g1_i1:151-726(+)